MLKHFARFSANVTFSFKAFEIRWGKKASILGDHSIGVLIGLSNWSAFGVVKRFLGFKMFMGKWVGLNLEFQFLMTTYEGRSTSFDLAPRSHFYSKGWPWNLNPRAFDRAGKFEVLNMPFFSLIQDFVLRIWFLITFHTFFKQLVPIWIPFNRILANENMKI